MEIKPSWCCGQLPKGVATAAANALGASEAAAQAQADAIEELAAEEGEENAAEALEHAVAARMQALYCSAGLA